MEVNHHLQLENKHKHKHKLWKEYLLEGLMIFIAVMLGFIAENIRENLTVKEKKTNPTSEEQVLVYH